MTEAAIGTTRKEKKEHGLFTMTWVTVWGVYVPEAWSASVLLNLELATGIVGRAQGHTIQVQWDADDPERIERTRDWIRDYGKAAWKRPLEGVAKQHFLDLAEALISRQEARR